MSENVVDVTVNDDTLTVETNGTFAPIVAKVDDSVCSVYALATDGKPIASMIAKDKETGTETPVHVSTCAEAVVCSQGIPMETHLAALYGHATSVEAHLSAGEKAELETKAGAQEKATAAKNEAISSASLMVESAKTAAANDATQKANAARDAAYKYAKDIVDTHTSNKSNPHNVTAAQVGLGNVANKAPNDLQITYSKASSLGELVSGERLAVAFGKIAKAIADLIAHISNKTNPHNVTATQVGAFPAIADATYPSCYYRMVDGEKEWINPPMVSGVEYRTMERYLGKPVKTKVINCGVVAKGGTLTFAHNCNISVLVRSVINAGRNAVPLIYNGDTENQYSITGYVNKDNVVVKNGSGNSENSIHAQIWYTND